MRTTDIARVSRVRALQMVNLAKSAHIGSSLSCIDILSVLYSRINPSQSLDRQEIVLKKLRDAFIASNSLINMQHILDSEKETWIMVEDTSLCIDKLGGFPGPFIKYYLQSLSLSAIANANWASKANSYVSLAIGRYSENNELIARYFENSIEGLIVEPRGTNGFGYDAIFRPEESNNTNAEMTMDEKEKFNPRTKAFQKVIDFLRS